MSNLEKKLDKIEKKIDAIEKLHDKESLMCEEVKDIISEIREENSEDEDFEEDFDEDLDDEDIEMGEGAKRRQGTKDFVLSGFVKGAEVNIDTKRNQLITAIETELESDITRGGNALDTEVISVETDEGTLFPIGGIRMTIRCIYTFESGTP